MIEQEPIPEYYPTVVMDIRLGKKYSSVEFDYGTFSEICDTQGISQEETAQLTIVLNKGFDIIPGHFEPADNKVRINAHGDINKHLAHELSHVADHLHNKHTLSLFHEISNKSLRPALYTGVGAFCLTVANMNLDMGIDRQTLAWIDYGIVTALGVMTIGSAMESGEIKAARIARRANSEVFQMIKR